MAEIPAGTQLQLAPGTRPTFLDYARCKLITIEGGTNGSRLRQSTCDGE